MVSPALTPEAERIVKRALRAKRGADEAQRVATAAMDQAVKRLIVKDGMTLRDAGDLLDVSYQRVQQIVERVQRAGGATLRSGPPVGR